MPVAGTLPDLGRDGEARWVRGERETPAASAGAASDAPRLDVRGLSKTFPHGGGEVEVLREVSLSVPAGGFVTLLGPSGCGKSTLLELIAGLVPPDHGGIYLNGHAVQEPGAAGYMPQRDLLLPWRTLLQNVTLGPEVRRRSPRTAREEALQLLHRFGLGGFEHVLPAELSGGMRQRAALLRTVMYERRFLILDEPLSALDALTRLELQGWLGGLVSELGSTTLLVTHDVREALRLSDTVLVLSGRPAVVRAALDLPGSGPRDAAQLATPDFARIERELLETLGVAS